MTPKYREEVSKLLAGLDDDENNQKREPESNIPPSPEIKREIHYIFVREQEDEDTQDFVVDSVVSDLDTAPLTTQPVLNAAIGVWLFGLLVPLFCLAVQLYFIVNPYTVTLILDARERQIALNGTLQLGRLINPITLSQSATTPTTGRGHQDARSATGSITFYNGQLTSVFIPAGTMLTGTSGVQIITDTDVTIPAANLPQVGQAAVSAHAVTTGSSGNIAAYDINQGCCATAIKAVNTTSFSGGQDERNFQTVAPSDITNTATPLKAAVNQSMQNTLSGQLKSGEALTSPTCTTTQTSDHQTGQEATQVKVTVSEMCSASAYNQDTLQVKVTQLLTTRAIKKLGTGYSMLDAPQVNATQAQTHGNKVVVSFTAQSAWIYALGSQEQQAIKKLIAGKTTEKALQLLTRLPGIERISLTSSGFGDGSRIPKDLSYIHLALIYGL